MIKYIISDVDGTLLGNDKQLPQRNFNAIQKAQKSGIQFGIATGRDIKGMMFVSEKYGIRLDLGVVGNGAQAVDKNGRFLAECYLQTDAFLKATAILTQQNLPYMVYTKEGVFAVNPEWVRDCFIERSRIKHGATASDYQPGGRLSHMACMTLQPIDDLSTFAERHDMIKVESFAVDVSHIIKTKSQISQIPNISCLSSFPDNIEITDHMAQKGLVLERILPLLNATKEEVVVIGDALNDTTLFECFPYAFAPSNAIEEIKKKAFKVVSSNDDGAVADAIEWALKYNQNEIK
ncbi:HAD family hydrolase [Carnobacteriaceae bacterium zg-C25]|nr:HAD family hydrolase [Carnobacteriaceae bacterium zg-C25]